MAKLTTEEFIAKAKMVHGDKYDYSKVEYVGQKAKVCILCKEHGEFLQTPYDHLSGHGCIKCHCKAMARRYSLGKEKFIEKANAVHRGFYDYSEVEYVNGHTKVKITCPIHGIFEQDPASHLQGHGCPFCADVENGMSPAVKLQRDIKLAQRFREAILVPMYLPEKKDSWKSSTGLMK